MIFRPTQTSPFWTTLMALTKRYHHISMTIPACPGFQRPYTLSLIKVVGKENYAGGWKNCLKASIPLIPPSSGSP